jgi:hypothetical protein
MRKTSAKVERAKKRKEERDFPLDTNLEKPRRGRRPTIPASWIRGRADNYRWIFNLLWNEIGPKLSQAVTAQDVVNSFSGTKVGSYALEFIPLAELILSVLRERRFPKRKREAQINFLADSIAGYGVVTPRSSRDICERERAQIKKSAPHPFF